jgi:pancreas-specific transcription factor 1a
MMFSMDTFDFETVMSRHLFEGPGAQQYLSHNGTSSNSSDYYLCDDNTTDSDSFSNFSDQENSEIKE